MSFICKNGTEHRHETREEARICWGLMRPTTPPPAPVKPYGTHPHRDPMTAKQRDFIVKLGGDPSTVTYKDQASVLIDRLLKEGRKPVEPATATTGRSSYVTKTKVPIPLLDAVSDGYYAVRPDSNHNYTFLRISRRPSKQFPKGSTKVQTQHGPNWVEEFVVWPSGQVSIYKWTIEEALMLLIPDQQGAARAYAKEIGRCCRCNTELTDRRSRHYGIGPECEKHWAHMIETVDLENDGHSFEWLEARGLIDD